MLCPEKLGKMARIVTVRTVKHSLGFRKLTGF